MKEIYVNGSEPNSVITSVCICLRIKEQACDAANIKVYVS